MADLNGIASVITAVAVLVSSLGTLRITRRSHKLMVSVDRAVNGKPEGAQTMGSQVQDLHDEMENGGHT